MSFLPNLRRAVLGGTREEKVIGTPSVAYSSYYNSLSAYNHSVTRDWPIERAVAEGYDRVIWVFKSVNTIAADAARLPFRLRDGEGEDAPVVDDHPLYRVLNKKANPLETGQVFRKRLSAQILLSKRGAFVEVTKSNGGSVIRLDLLPPDRVEIIPGSGEDLVKHFRLNRRNGSVKNLDPEKVRWFRNPHPIDPYSGVTPLEAAGMSVELDHFARLYNVTFMQNDGRPGGVIAVKNANSDKPGDIDPVQMDRIEERFGKGPVEAGKLSVIAGDLSYVDLATRPRDMQYGQTSANSKSEILGAFGLGEVVFGTAAGRTFDNADNELYVYWTRTQPEHHEILLTGFDEDSEDDLNGFLDTSGVEVLERAAKARRIEQREEVAAGLRSIKSYADNAGHGDEIDDTPHTRALYVPSGKTPLPSREADAEALGLAVPEEGGEPELPPAGGAPAALPPGQAAPAIPAGSGGPPALPGALSQSLGSTGGSGGAGGGENTPTAPSRPAPTAPGAPGAPSAARAALAAVAGTKGAGADPKVRAVYRLSRNAKSAYGGTEHEPDDEARDAFEAQIAAALEALTERWIGRATARVSSPKARKGTRFWTPEFDNDTRVGTKALDAADAVNAALWQEEAEDVVSPLITSQAVAVIAAMLSDANAPLPPGLNLIQYAARVAAQTVGSMVAYVGRSAAGQAQRLVADINNADQDGVAFTDLTELVEGRAKRLGSWARGLAVQVATGTTGSATDAAAVEAEAVNPDVEIDRTWITKRDADVRDSHRLADGQVRELGETFIVGDALLRWPGDILAPVHETANCRCRLRYRIRSTGVFTTRPPGQPVNPRTGKALPVDADGDGFIYDGTPRQRLAPRVVAVPDVAPDAAPRESALAKGAARLARHTIDGYGAYSGPRIPANFDGQWVRRSWNPRIGEVTGEPEPAPPMMAREDVEAMLYATFETEFTTRSGRRVEAVVDSVLPMVVQAQVDGRLTDADTGEHLGTFTRMVYADRSVSHESLHVGKPYRNDGIGAEFNAHAMAMYRQLGFDTIKVVAGGSRMQDDPEKSLNGGYVWATQGYDFEPDGDPPFEVSTFGTLIRQAQEAVKAGGADTTEGEWLADSLDFKGRLPAAFVKDNLGWLAELLASIDRSNPPTPYELAMLGADRPFTDVDTGATTWLGQALMSRSTWAGYFDMSWLDPYLTKALASERGLLLAERMLTSLGDDDDAMSENVVSGAPADET